VGLGVAVLLLAGCSSASTATTPTLTPRPPPARPAACAWYTPTATPGENVNVSATGPVCHDQSLIGWLVSDSDRPWTTESVIPGAMGQLVATLAKGRSTAQVWFTGPLPSPTTSAGHATQTMTPAAELAGRIAVGLERAGWSSREPGMI